MDAFDAADRERPDGRSMAYIAYCLAKLRDYSGAAACYERARVVCGYEAAWARNNRAYALIQQRSPEYLRQAAAEAEAALGLDPDLCAAHLNRAYARFLGVWIGNPKGWPTEDLKLVEDARFVLRTGPKTAELFFTAAQIVLTFGGGTEAARTEAVGYLNASVGLGRSPKSLAADPVFKAQLSGREDFRRVTALPEPNSLPTSPGPVADPHLAQPPELAAEDSH